MAVDPLIAVSHVTIYFGTKNYTLMLPTVAADPHGRGDLEMSWVAIQPFLESQGYRLRPRFHPNWTPSWIQQGLTIVDAYRLGLEDTLIIPVE